MSRWVRVAVGISTVGLAVTALSGCTTTGVGEGNSGTEEYEASQLYWYCWDEGATDPHHLGEKVDGDHVCTGEELTDAGYAESPDGRWYPESAPTSSGPPADEQAPQGRVDEDLQVFEDLRLALEEWNTAAGAFLSGYLDESVTYEAWLGDAPDQIHTMDRSRLKVSVASVMLNDAALGAWMEEFALVRADELAAMESLVSAEQYGSEEDVQTAWEDLVEAGSAAEDHARTLPDALEGLEGAAGVADELRQLMIDAYGEA